MRCTINFNFNSESVFMTELRPWWSHCWSSPEMKWEWIWLFGKRLATARNWRQKK